MQRARERIARSLSICLFVALGCADDSPPRGAEALAALEQSSNASWRGVLRGGWRDVSFVSRVRERAPLPSEDVSSEAESRARTFLIAWPGLFGAAARADALELRHVSSDGFGGTRLRFGLRVDGLLVESGDAVVVVDQDGHVRTASGTFPIATRLAATPRIAPDAAATAARTGVAVEFPSLRLELEDAPELVATPFEGELRPIWRVVVRGEDLDHSPALVRREVHVDAATGSILRQRDVVYGVTPAVGSGVGVNGERKPLDLVVGADGVYVLRDEIRGIRTYTAGNRERLPGKLVRSTNPHAWDEANPGAGAAVDAHAHAAQVHDYLSSFGRRSVDGENSAIRVVVHYARSMENAFWDGRRAVFGDGSGDSAPFSASLDIVAHELFHGVTEADSGLVYEGEQGALNESLSDVFGTFVEHRWSDGDWTIAEDVMLPPLRNLARPSESDLPSHMSEYVWLPSLPEFDMGGVHINSTIPSHAAYLLAEGGTHSISRVRVDGIGVAKTERIWYRAASVYLSSSAGFADFAEATRAAAEDYFGPGSEEVQQVERAWHAVGVL